MKVIIRIVDVDEEQECEGSGYLIQVEEKKLGKVKAFIENLITKWYGNRHDYYSNTYGGLFDFIDYKLNKAHIKYETPQIINIYF